MGLIQYNSVKIDGDNNLVLQSVDGETLRVSLSEFIDKFTREKNERITLLQKALYDKEKIEIFSDEKIATLSAELQRVTEERDAQTLQIIKMLEDFAQKDIAASGTLYQQAFNLFIAAKLDDALALLSEARLQEELIIIEQREEASRQERRNLANNYLLRAKILQLQFDFVEAASCTEKAVVICPEWGYYLEAGNFLKFLNRLKEAEFYWQAALLNVNSPTEKARTLNNLAVLRDQQNEYDKAEANYSEALIIQRQLATTDQHAYLPDVAMTLNNLAILQRKRKEYTQAEANYIEALTLLRELISTNPQIYLPKVAHTLNNLAILQQERKEYEKAEANYNEALDINKKLAATNPHTYLNDVAVTLNNLAILQKSKNELKKAEVNYIAALSIRRKLAAINPQAYLPYLADILNNLSNLQVKKEENDKAEANFSEAVSIYRKLILINRQPYLPYLAGTLNNLAILQTDEAKYSAADANFSEALGIYKQLAVANSRMYLPDVGMVLSIISMLYTFHENYKNREKALHSAREAMKIALPFSHFDRPSAEYIQDASDVLKYWGEDAEAFISLLKTQ